MQNFLYILIFYIGYCSFLLADMNVFYPTEIPKRHDELSFTFFAGHYDDLVNQEDDLMLRNQLLLADNTGYNLGFVFNPLYNLSYYLYKIDVMLHSNIDTSGLNNYMMNIFITYNIIKNNYLRFYVGYSILGKSNVVSYNILTDAVQDNSFYTKGYIVGGEIFMFKNVSLYIDYKSLQSNGGMLGNYGRYISRTVNMGSKIHVNLL
jgi:hypothetical protein